MDARTRYPLLVLASLIARTGAAAPDPAAVKTVDNETPGPDEPVEFTITITHFGDQTAEGDDPFGLASSSNCFIATAAYGSPLHPHVEALREFRDSPLLTNAPGRAFVDFYCRHSPSAAAIIADNGGPGLNG